MCTEKNFKKEMHEAAKYLVFCENYLKSYQFSEISWEDIIDLTNLKAGKKKEKGKSVSQFAEALYVLIGTALDDIQRKGSEQELVELKGFFNTIFKIGDSYFKTRDQNWLIQSVEMVRATKLSISTDKALATFKSFILEEKKVA